jgi:FixJ family two-component response regulator
MDHEPAVYIVDDDPSVRRAIQRLLEAEGLPVRAYASAAEFLEEITPAAGGCIVLDLRMPRMGGLEVQTTLAERQIELPILFVSAHGDISSSVRAMKSGAVDFLEKPFNEQQLLDAVHVAMARDARMRAARQKRSDVLHRIESLSPRERDVFALVVQGKLNKQIAVELGISEVTVKVHRGRVMTKMGAESLAELVILAERAGINTTKV